MVIFTARQNLANLNEVKMNLIVKVANLAGKSYIMAVQLYFLSKENKNTCLIYDDYMFFRVEVIYQIGTNHS